MDYIYKKLRSSEVIDDAKTLWSDYRLELTDYILNVVDKGSSLCVLGAGAMNDMDLDLLEENYVVTLIDRNAEALELVSTNAKKIEKDLWQITDEDLMAFEELLRTYPNMDDTIAFMDKLCNRIVRDKVELDGRYDVIVTAGLHSQLNVIFISIMKYYVEEGLCHFTKEELDRFLKAISNMNVVAVDKLQGLIKESCDKQLLVYEHSSYDSFDDTLYEVMDMFYEGRAQDVASMNISRVEGASQVERWLGNSMALSECNITSLAYYCWPIVKEKKYLMVAYGIEYIR